MGKFQKGDYVRRTKPSDDPKQFGVVGGVYKLIDTNRFGLFVIKGEPAADESAFELWQPRVGERVRIVKPRHDFKMSYKGREFTVTERQGSCDGEAAFVGYPESRPYIWTTSELEPVLVDVPVQTGCILKIEAGKFYKTRDGRKVGPTTHNGYGVYGAPGHPNKWYETGFSFSGKKELPTDLVAEWVDEPVAKASNSEASNDNEPRKFKAGDQVRCLKSFLYEFTEGKVYTVSEDYRGERYESVKIALDDKGSTQNGWSPEFFELVTPTTTNASIVALIEDGKPKPAAVPFVHSSTSAAETEAKRLAGKHKGKKFGVFTLTTTHEVSAPVYGQKWQNLAALGLKIDAIKELRALASLDLAAAKQAVETFVAKAA